MRCAFRVRLALRACVAALALLKAGEAQAQELPRVSVSRSLRVEGLTAAPRLSDLLGLRRTSFQGLIALELASVGYQVEGASSGPGQEPPLVLAGVVQEEVCDDVAPSQCRVAIQWELQEPSGLVVYRTTTRAVDQQPTLEQLRRGLVQGALRSLMGRRRFTARLGFAERAPRHEPLGFERCRREALALPSATRAALSGLVLVESGSRLGTGAILSRDGLILTSARNIDPGAPLRVRFSAQQVVAARLVASAVDAGVALLLAEAHSPTCVPLRESVLAVGSPSFGVAGEPGEGHALSLSSSTLEGVSRRGEHVVLRVDGSVARSAGSPLLDEDGRLAAVVVEAATGASSAEAVEVYSALAALDVKAAAITDPRLVHDSHVDSGALGYVRDADDPPFALTRSYTYGTSALAGNVRTAGFVTAGVGAVAVAATWLEFRSSDDISADAHARLVVLNDVGWAVLALGAIGVGVSYVLPEPHDVVAGHGSAQRHWSLRLAANGLGAAGEF